ncbi:hypothetical protein [Morganella morganii IS15]|nr:hypothetical protein CSB69_1407 [Morganella morganii]EMP50046.1 hypothetical protein C790_02718 [Morganella morganii SC01]ETO43054.1 hypothetical protein X965_17875 [Morganella sp. EGD-HP17]CDK68503.1 hypothetical protein [Morganella morganii IS15]
MSNYSSDLPAESDNLNLITYQNKKKLRQINAVIISSTGI